MSKRKNLKLIAENDEDLTVFSSVLQDSLIAIRDVRFVSGNKRFLFVANRFRWEAGERPEKDENGEPVYERVHCGVCFEHVNAVRQKGLNRDRRGVIVSLLSISHADGVIELSFSAGISFRLEVDKLMCHLQDMDEPWPTRWRPTHSLD